MVLHIFPHYLVGLVLPTYVEKVLLELQHSFIKLLHNFLLCFGHFFFDRHYKFSLIIWMTSGGRSGGDSGGTGRDGSRSGGGPLCGQLKKRNCFFRGLAEHGYGFTSAIFTLSTHTGFCVRIAHNLVSHHFKGFRRHKLGFDERIGNKQSIFSIYVLGCGMGNALLPS